MKQFFLRNGRAPLTRAAACVALCALCFHAAAAPQGSAGHAQASAATPGRSTTRPVRAVEPAAPAAASAAQAPAASQPVVARSAIDQREIRRDAPRGDSTGDATAAASTAAPDPVPGFDLPRVLGALALVFGLIFTLRYVLRRSINPASLPGATNAVQVLTRSPLAPRQQLLLVRVGRRLLVVSDCNGQLSSLSEITDADEVAALVGQLRDEKLTSASKSFGNLLGIWRREPEDAGDDEAADGGAEEYPRAAPEVRARHGGGEDDAADPSVASARSEIHGLMERVRLISHQFKRE